MAKKKTERKAVTLSTRLSAVECSQEAITEALTANDVALARVFYRLGVAEGLERRIVHLESILGEGHARLGEPLEAYMARREAEPPSVDVEHLRYRIEDLEAARANMLARIPEMMTRLYVLEEHDRATALRVDRLQCALSRTWRQRLAAWCKWVWAGVPEEAQ